MSYPKKNPRAATRLVPKHTVRSSVRSKSAAKPSRTWAGVSTAGWTWNGQSTSGWTWNGV